MGVGKKRFFGKNPVKHYLVVIVLGLRRFGVACNPGGAHLSACSGEAQYTGSTVFSKGCIEPLLLWCNADFKPPRLCVRRMAFRQAIQ